MNKIYEFTLHPSGYDVAVKNLFEAGKPRFYVIGAGTLKDGLELLDDMNYQFNEWCDNLHENRHKHGEPLPIKVLEVEMFKLRIPSQSTPISLWEGADIFASGGPFGTPSGAKANYGKELFEEYIYTAEEGFVDSYKWEPWND
tara:strand:- start:227 stop:655 length:429 start_codon:yes stop_codon:yes gene_type:complete